jgi:integrase/recombinase XerD
MNLSVSMVKYLFEEHLKNKGYSKESIRRYMWEVKLFFSWLERYASADIREVTRERILDYQKFLYTEKRRGKQLSTSTQRGMMFTLKQLFKFLSKNEYILENPFDSIELKRLKEKKLRQCVSEKNINLVLDNISDRNIAGIRDRALFELMYGTGLRVSEASNLDMSDIDLSAGKLLVREGKGKIDRVLPIGENVKFRLIRYIEYARSEYLAFVKDSSNKDALFLSIEGNRMNSQLIGLRLKKRFRNVELDPKKICPHMIRHSFATHILENGAGIKHVKDMLGHACIESTVNYTHFSVKSLKRIIKLYHPRENELYEEFDSAKIAEILKQ